MGRGWLEDGISAGYTQEQVGQAVVPPHRHVPQECTPGLAHLTAMWRASRSAASCITLQPSTRKETSAARPCGGRAAWRQVWASWRAGAGARELARRARCQKALAACMPLPLPALGCTAGPFQPPSARQGGPPHQRRAGRRAQDARARHRGHLRVQLAGQRLLVLVDRATAQGGQVVAGGAQADGLRDGRRARLKPGSVRGIRRQGTACAFC